jgi:hypothetical protein
LLLSPKSFLQEPVGSSCPRGCDGLLQTLFLYIAFLDTSVSTHQLKSGPLQGINAQLTCCGFFIGTELNFFPALWEFPDVVFCSGSKNILCGRAIKILKKGLIEDVCTLYCGRNGPGYTECCANGRPDLNRKSIVSGNPRNITADRKLLILGKQRCRVSLG